MRSRNVAAPPLASRAYAMFTHESPFAIGGLCPHKACRTLLEHDPEKVVIVTDVPDNCQPNLRCKKAFAAEFPGSVLYDYFGGCAAHKLHGFVVRVIGEERVVGHVHAVQTVLGVAGWFGGPQSFWSSGLPLASNGRPNTSGSKPANLCLRTLRAAQGRRETLQKALRQLVEAELKTIEGKPPIEHVHRNELIVNHTFMRTHSVVRARAGDLRPAKRGTSLEAAIPGFLQMVNGDARVPVVTHYCSGCCRNADGQTTRAQQVLRWEESPRASLVCF